MAAAATPEPPTGVSLIELALEAGYAFADQPARLPLVTCISDGFPLREEVARSWLACSGGGIRLDG
jgi:hypothetical protein